jgi:hypothetical protein
MLRDLSRAFIRVRVKSRGIQSRLNTKPCPFKPLHLNPRKCYTPNFVVGFP